MLCKQSLCSVCISFFSFKVLNLCEASQFAHKTELSQYCDNCTKRATNVLIWFASAECCVLRFEWRNSFATIKMCTIFTIGCGSFACAIECYFYYTSFWLHSYCLQVPTKNSRCIDFRKEKTSRKKDWEKKGTSINLYCLRICIHTSFTSVCN